MCIYIYIYYTHTYSQLQKWFGNSGVQPSSQWHRRQVLYNYKDKQGRPAAALPLQWCWMNFEELMQKSQWPSWFDWMVANMLQIYQANMRFSSIFIVGAPSEFLRSNWPCRASSPLLDVRGALVRRGLRVCESECRSVGCGHRLQAPLDQIG